MDIDDILKSFEKEENDRIVSVGTEPILFIHDSNVRVRGEVFSFNDNEYSVLSACLKKSKIPQGSFQYLPSLKSINVSEKDVTTEMLHENRPHLEECLKSVTPKLIFVLGNLAMKMLLRKSGISNKRGKEFWVNIDGVDIPVVPLFHPFSIYSEPKLRGLFLQDLNNAYDKFILDKNKLSDSSYKLHNDVEAAIKALERVMKYDAVAVDLETTGLDFKKDKITTMGFAVGEKDAFVIPVHHRESELSDNDLERVREVLIRLFESDSIAKILHNCKFDLKFLSNWGVTSFYNIQDTQVMHSLVDENLPHGLMDVVKEYFPHELDKF